MKQIILKILSFLKPKRNAAGTGAGQAAGANSSYNQENRSDYENSISLNEIKNKYNKKSNKQDESHGHIYSSDKDDGSDFEARRSNEIDKTKISKPLRDSDEESDDGTDRGGNDSGSEKSGSEAAVGSDKNDTDDDGSRDEN